MSRIKVTGYLETDELEVSEVDLSDPTGLSESAYIAYMSGGRGLYLDDLDFELEKE